MIHTRRHMTEETKKAIEKARRQIRKLSYLDFEKAKEIRQNIYSEFMDSEWFEKLTYWDKMELWIKKEKAKKWLEYLESVKGQEVK